MVQTPPTESLTTAPSLANAPRMPARIELAPMAISAPTIDLPIADPPVTLPTILVRPAPRSTTRRPIAWPVCVSVLVHVAAGIALARTAGIIAPRVEVSEAGLNSIALIASMEVVAPVNPAEQLVVSAAPESEQEKAEQESAAAIERVMSHAKLLAGPRRIELAQVDSTIAETKVVEHENSKEGDDRGEKPPTPSQASPGAVASRGADIDRLPAAVFNPAPVYPPDAQRNRWSGRVLLRVKVAADGQVLSAEIATSSGIKQLDDSALAAVRQWRFTPAQRDGVNVAWEIGVPVRFVVQAPR
jgi:protein TonB